MILFLFSVLNQATLAWQASEKKVDAFREARAALYVMRRDLSGALIQTNLPFVSNLAGEGKPILITGQLASTNSLFFISAQPSGAQGSQSSGDLCGVGYYVAWSKNDFQAQGSSTTDRGVSKSYNLFRYFREGSPTFTNISTYMGSSTPLLGDLFPGASPLGGDEVLARNVLAFSIQPYERVGSAAPTMTNGAITNRFSYLDVDLSVVNYDTAAKLGDSEGVGANWNTNSVSSTIKELITRNKQDFHIRIPFTQ